MNGNSPQQMGFGAFGINPLVRARVATLMGMSSPQSRQLGIPLGIHLLNQQLGGQNPPAGISRGGFSGSGFGGAAGAFGAAPPSGIRSITPPIFAPPGVMGPVSPLSPALAPAAPPLSTTPATSSWIAPTVSGSSTVQPATSGFTGRPQF